MTPNALNQSDIADHLDMSERNARYVLKGLGIDWRTATLDEMRIAYIRDLREKAAGRGGDDNVTLARRRAEESEVKTAMLRLEYNEKINTLVPAEDAAMVIADWCGSANREYRGGIGKLVSEIQSTFKIEIPSDLVENIVSLAIRRIQDHAVSIGKNLTESGEDFHATTEEQNGGMDQ